MNLYPDTYYLRELASKQQWQSASNKLCQQVISQIMDAPATKESWFALLELFSVWPEATDIEDWVHMLEPQIDHWPWQARESSLGQSHTLGKKGIVYLLIAYLYIDRIEDLFGHKLTNWSQNAYWRNLKGISLSRMEVDLSGILCLLQSEYLRHLQEIRFSAIEILSGDIVDIFHAVHLEEIKCFRLTSLNLTKSDILSLAEQSISQSLETLDISNNFIYGEDLVEILQYENFPELRLLDVSYTEISAEELARLLSTLNHACLKKIVIKHTPASKILDKEIIDIPL